MAHSAPASLPNDDDMLPEIVLRLPPQPSSLPRASAVCKRWLGLVTDPNFHRQFRAHHRKPPLLGFLELNNNRILFRPALSPPDRVPPHHFNLGHVHLLDCHHGYALVQHINRQEVVVYDLITCLQRRVTVPPEFRNFNLKPGAVLCAASNRVHGSGHLSPFKVVLICDHRPHYRPCTRVYSLETGLWGNLISMEVTCRISQKHVVLVGKCLYWSSCSDDGILEFDLDENSLTVISWPHPVTNEIKHENYQIIEAEDGALGFAMLSYPGFQLWQRNVNAHGVATWVPWKTIDMRSIPGLPPPHIEGEIAWLFGYDEDTDVILLHSSGNVYGAQLKLMQSSKFCKTPYVNYCQAFKSFYTPGTTIAGEFKGVEM